MHQTKSRRGHAKHQRTQTIENMPQISSLIIQQMLWQHAHHNRHSVVKSWVHTGRPVQRKSGAGLKRSDVLKFENGPQFLESGLQELLNSELSDRSHT